MYIFKRFKSGVGRVNLSLYWIAGSVLFIPIVVTVIDVIGRYLRHPLPGALEINEYALIMIFVLAWAHTQTQKGHISVDLLYRYFSSRVQGILDVVSSLVGLVVAGFISWAAILYAINALGVRGGSSATLHIPGYPFKFLIFIGALALFCQFILDIRNSFRQTRGQNNGDST